MNTYKYTYLITPDNYFKHGQMLHDIEKRLAGNDFKATYDPDRLPIRLMTNIEPLKFHELLASFPCKINIDLIYSEGWVSSDKEKPATKPCLGPLKKYKIMSPSTDTIDVLLKVLREKYGYFSIDNHGARAPLAKTEFFMQIKHFVEIDIDLSYADMFKAIEHDMAKIEGYKLRFIGSLFNWRDINCHFENGQTIRIEPLYPDPGMPFIEMPSYEELKLQALNKPSIDDQKKYIHKLEFQFPDHERISQLVEKAMIAQTSENDKLFKEVVEKYLGHPYQEEDMNRFSIYRCNDRWDLVFDNKLIGCFHYENPDDIRFYSNNIPLRKIIFTPAE